MSRTPLLTFALIASFTPAAAARGQEVPPIPADTEIVTTESGLKYSVLQEGNGEEFPGRGDRVRVHYTGWLPDGTLFDSSRQRGEPAEFAVSRVIAGWTEGLQLMSPGARFKLTIPADLGYGDQGSPPKIPGGATLIFDVELLEITAHTLEHVTWSDEGAEELESGLAYKVLEAGEGLACSEADLVILEFAMFDAGGQPLLSSAMEGGPLIGKPKGLALEFMDEAMSVARNGSHLVLRVPTDKMTRISGMPGVEEGQSYTWQIVVTGAYRFEKPDFVLPPDEELTATESGLRYKVLREGAGKRPKASNTVVAHYAGWLTDGKPFDNSYDRGQPSSFPLNRVIAGWTEGLQLMETGAKFLFVIPSDLGYGAGGTRGIPGGATLVFVVELVDVR